MENTNVFKIRMITLNHLNSNYKMTHSENLKCSACLSLFEKNKQFLGEIEVLKFEDNIEILKLDGNKSYRIQEYTLSKKYLNNGILSNDIKDSIEASKIIMESNKLFDFFQLCVDGKKYLGDLNINHPSVITENLN